MRNLQAALLIGWTTLRRKRGGLLAFAVATLLFEYIVVASFPAIGGDAAVQSVVRTFPSGLRRLLRIAPNFQAGFGLIDYVALGFFHPVFLGFGAAFVVGRATDALAGEIERGSIYLLLSRPLARWALVLGKTLDLLGGAAVIAGAGWLGVALATLTTRLPQAVPLDRLLLVALLAWLLFGALGAGALVISSLGTRTARIAGLGTAWTLISFVLDVLPAVTESPLAVFNPWHGYDPQAILATGQLDPLALLVLLGWIVGGSALAMLCFSRRDLA